MKNSRYLAQYLSEICFESGKMAFVSGPRQAGKTTMAKMLLAARGAGEYYNWDELNFRRLWTKNPSSILLEPAIDSEKTPLVVLDEIHKARLWKKNLKGVYDTLKTACDILVTGSARLNVYRKGSDSLLGRYYHFRLHPFSLSELEKNKKNINPNELLDFIFTKKCVRKKSSEDCLERLDQFGGFPEPYLSGSKRTLNLWQRGRIEKIVKEDLRDISRLPELSQIDMLVSLLPERAANMLSAQSLSEDLEVAYTTVRRWLNYLKELYYCYEIKPYAKSLKRSLKKEGKLYLWDWSEIEDEGARFENLVASHLLKYTNFLTDIGEGKFDLHYLRNKEKQEIDFLMLKDNKPWLPIEVKLNQEELSKNWHVFMSQLGLPYGIQLVKKPGVYKVIKRDNYQILVISAAQFLNHLI